MRKSWPVLALSLFVALSGCTGDPADPEAGAVDGTTDAAAPLPVPVWAVGDHWTYQSSFGTFTLAVSGESGSDYILDTDDEDLAFFHAAFDPVSYIGAMSKAKLAGDDGGARTVFFDFPLEHEKTWSTQLDGVPLQVTAHDQGDGRFHMMAHAGDVMRHQWMYDNATGFFAWASFGDENGTEQYRLDLEHSGHGWTGELVRVTPEQVLDLQMDGPGQETNTLDFGEPGDADLFAAISTTCTQGYIMVAAGPLENIQGAQGSDDGYTDASLCAWENSFFGVIGWQPGQGTWGYSVDHVSPDASTSMSLWLRHFERFTL